MKRKFAGILAVVICMNLGLTACSTQTDAPDTAVEENQDTEQTGETAGQDTEENGTQEE